MKKQTFLQGGIILGVMGILTKALGALFRVPLTRTLGDAGLGYYQIVFSILTIFIAISGGLSTGISKIVSENNDRGKSGDNVKIVKLSIAILFLLAILNFLVVFFLRDVMIESFNWDPKVIYSLLAVSIVPMFLVVLNPIRGYFQGHENMNTTAVSQFLEQVGRVGVGLALAYLLVGQSIELAAAGAVIGAAGGGIFATIYLVYKFIKLNPKSYKNSTPTIVLLKKLILVSSPMAFGAILGSLMGFIDAFLLPGQLEHLGIASEEANRLLSQFSGKASTITHIPLTLAVSIGCALVPAVSASIASRNKNELNRTLNLSFKFAFVVAIPCFLGLFFLAEPIMTMIFGKNNAGGEILKYLSFSIPFLVLIQIQTAILQGIGKAKISMISMGIGVVIKIILIMTLVRIPSINIYGAVISSIAVSVVICSINAIMLKKYVEYKFDWLDICLKPIGASLIMVFVALASFSFILELVKVVSVACLGAIAISGFVYIILIFVFKVLDYESITNRVSQKVKNKVS